MAYIYKITNNINKKVYIGKTLKTIESRWKEHKKDFIREEYKNRPLYRAFKKYGVENFSIEEIEKCSEQDASKRECYWIEQYGSFKNGYNATLGGEGKRYADYNLICSLWEDGNDIETIHKITKYDADTIRSALDDNNITSEIRKQRQYKSFSKPVAMLDKDTKEILKVFSSISEAYKFLNKSGDGHISSVCKGKRKTAYGYSWKLI